MEINKKFMFKEFEQDKSGVVRRRFNRRKFEVRYIVLHHTVGGTAKSTIEYWRNREIPIGTEFIIDRDGTIYRVLPENCWAYHIGLKGEPQLESKSIGIELANWGPLTESNGQYINAYGKPVNTPVEILQQPFRNYTVFDRYTNAQITSCVQLVDALCHEYKVPRRKPPKLYSSTRQDVQDILFFTGITAHCHFRIDKSDIYPTERIWNFF